MDREAAIEIIEEVADVIGGKVRAGYSGRGMYGATCYGIACDDWLECHDLAREKGLKGDRRDQMGKGWIVYWPAVTGEADE